MNANDNFENKDLINSNNTSASDIAETNAQEQNKEASEETKMKQKASLESKETPTIEKSAEAETKQEEKPEVEANSNILEAKPTEETVDKSEEETTPSTEAKKEEKPKKEGESVTAETKSIEKAIYKSEERTTSSTETKKEETEEHPTEAEKTDKPISIKKRAKPNVPLTFEEIVGILRKLTEKDKFSRKELEKAQGLFFSEIRKEAETQKEKFLADGGDKKDFEIKESELHTEGKNLLQILAEKRKKQAAEEEKQKEANYKRKLAIIEEVEALIESKEDFNKKFQDVKNLQNEWRRIKLVPHGKEHALWKSYQEQVEKFYDIVHIHNEYRDYDFKKNLQSKIGLCEAAEKLIKEDDVVSAFHQLQKLHNDWRDIGPVARKDRELIWQRFREASAEINRRYQARIEGLKAQENENYEKKVAICEKIEAIDLELLKNPREWESKTREVLQLQKDWRKIGYAPRKVNAKVFRRYRAACDLFFNTKNDFYQSIRGELEENLQKKIELCERAEAMKDSEDWRETTPKMIAIQKEWKEIGMVPRRDASRIWRRFIAACDHFFEQKKLHTKSIREKQAENLKLKTEVTDKIKNIDTSLPTEEAVEKLKDLMDEWHAIGFVPFKDKDKSYNEFTNATDAQYSRLNIDKSQRKLDSFKSNISEMTKSDHSREQVFHERNKLMRQFERMKSELQTYENNIGFLTASSKKGSSLLDDLNTKVEKTKAELELIVEKIETIDRNIEE